MSVDSSPGMNAQIFLEQLYPHLLVLSDESCNIFCGSWFAIWQKNDLLWTSEIDSFDWMGSDGRMIAVCVFGAYSALPICCRANDADVIGRSWCCNEKTTDTSHQKPVDAHVLAFIDRARCLEVPSGCPTLFTPSGRVAPPARPAWREFHVKGKGKGLDTCHRPLTWVRLVTSSALQSRKWQLIGMSQWCRSALCGHPLLALTDNWTHGAASRHTTAPISHTRPSPRSRRYYSFPVPLRVGGWVGLSTE